MVYTSFRLGTMSGKYCGSFCATACTPHTTLAFLVRRSVVGLGSQKVFFFFWFVRLFGTAATPGLLCQPRVIVKMIVEKQMECRLAGEPEVLGGNLPQRHFWPSKNPTCPDPGMKLGRRGGRPATNHLSYGAASVRRLLIDEYSNMM
jgi:hypothetical protein